MSTPTLEQFLAGVPMKFKHMRDDGQFVDATIKYVKDDKKRVGYFEIRDTATNRLTIRSIVHAIAFSTERRHVEELYRGINIQREIFGMTV